MSVVSGVTRSLSSFLADVNLQSVPADVRLRSKHLVLDALGCGLVGSGLAWSRRGADALLDLDQGSRATVWGRATKASAPMAALLNGSFVQGFEIDDYHDRGPLHVGSVVVTAAMALSEHIGSVPGDRFVEAVVLGQEVGPRVGMALGGMDLIGLGWHNGAVYGPLASAAACGKLLGLDESGFENALGIAATQACGLMSAQFEAMVKRMHHGFAARSGIIAAVLAQAGYTGSPAIIEREYGGYASTFRQDEKARLDLVTAGLGDQWEAMNICIKPYACMGGLHSPIDAIRSLHEEGKLTDPLAVERVVIKVPMWLVHKGSFHLERPPTEIGAQMHLPFAVALAIKHGNVLPTHFSRKELDDDLVWSLVERITVEYDSDLDDAGDEAYFATTTVVTLRDGSEYERYVQAPRGSSVHPLSNEEIVEKFLQLTEPILHRSRREKIVATVLALEDVGEMSTLAELMADEVPSAVG